MIYSRDHSGFRTGLENNAHNGYLKIFLLIWDAS